MFFDSVGLFILKYKMSSRLITIIVSVPCEIKYRLLETILLRTINGEKHDSKEFAELLFSSYVWQILI